MDMKGRVFSISQLTIILILVIISNSFLLSVNSLCKKNPIIFNFGDSNSDTGGYAATIGDIPEPPPGRRNTSSQLWGRWCDGRLVIDFLCESLKTKYLSPFLESIGSNFTNGVNFAVSNSSTRPRTIPFSLRTQISLFTRYQSRSIELLSQGIENFVKPQEYKNALYMIDIGQKDIDVALVMYPFREVVKWIPSFIHEIENALQFLYLNGGRNFWVHNTGPLGCWPKKLATTPRFPGDTDEYGCLRQVNEAAQIFNDKLRVLCEDLKYAMQEATIVCVDIYAIKRDLIVNAAKYGFQNPLMACCGHGGPPYNYDPDLQCGEEGHTVCTEGSRYISWDGVQYTEAANEFIASKILSKNYSTPALSFDYFCNL